MSLFGVLTCISGCPFFRKGSTVSANGSAWNKLHMQLMQLRVHIDTHVHVQSCMCMYMCIHCTCACLLEYCSVMPNAPIPTSTAFPGPGGDSCREGDIFVISSKWVISSPPDKPCVFLELWLLGNMGSAWFVSCAPCGQTECGSLEGACWWTPCLSCFCDLVVGMEGCLFVICYLFTDESGSCSSDMD